MTEPTVCSVCGEAVPRDALTAFDDQLLCAHCLYEETVTCTRCRGSVKNYAQKGLQALEE